MGTNETKRAGRKAGQGSKWIRPVKRLAIYCRDGAACIYCGRGIADGAVLSLDHILACELGGTNEHTNLVSCCIICNSSKSDLTTRQWFTVLRDRGVDTSAIGAKIRRHVARDLTPYLAQARRLESDAV
jgi:5-methylcytosine-specific restriction endonuclease McrA